AAPSVDPALFSAGVPVLGICYGFQLMAQALGGNIERTGRSEYGRTAVRIADQGSLLRGLPEDLTVWMSHGDAVNEAPPGFAVLGGSERSPVACFEAPDRRLAGLQWHPEVVHSEHGQEVLTRFLHDVAGCRPTWTMVNI